MDYLIVEIIMQRGEGEREIERVHESGRVILKNIYI